MTTINFETLEITDGTHTMQLDIRRIGNNALGMDTYYLINPFGHGEVSRKIDAALVPALVERAAAEVFPMFVAYETAATREEKIVIHRELSNIRWSI